MHRIEVSRLSLIRKNVNAVKYKKKQVNPILVFVIDVCKFHTKRFVLNHILHKYNYKLSMYETGEVNLFCVNTAIIRAEQICSTYVK